MSLQRLVYKYAIFIATLSILAKTSKQSRYSTIDERINKLWYVHIIGYYSAKKRNKLLYVYIILYIIINYYIYNKMDESQNSSTD